MPSEERTCGECGEPLPDYSDPDRPQQEWCGNPECMHGPEEDDLENYADKFLSDKQRAALNDVSGEDSGPSDEELESVDN